MIFSERERALTPTVQMIVDHLDWHWLLFIHTHIYLQIHNVLTNTQLLQSYRDVDGLLAACVCLSQLILHFGLDFHWAAARVPRLLLFVGVTCFVLGMSPWWNNESHAVVTGIVASSASEIAAVQQIRSSQGRSPWAFLSCLWSLHIQISSSKRLT